MSARGGGPIQVAALACSLAAMVPGGIAERVAAGQPVLEAGGAPQDQGPLLTGRVLEKGSGSPLAGVTVSIRGTGRSTETDVDGRFSLHAPAGRQVIQFDCPGYESHRMDFLFKTADVLLPDVYLEPEEDFTPAMVVETRRDVETMNLEILLPEEIERYPATHGDPVRAIESYPNVARPKFLDSALVVRGAEPANTVVLVEGHEVPFLYHFGIWKSVINPHFLQSIDYYPGGMPSSYGNVLQAVLDVHPRDLPVDRVHGVADVNLADTALTLTTPVLGGRVAVGAAMRFSYLSLLLLGGSSLTGAEQILFPRYSDYQVRLVSRGLGGTWSILFLGAKDAVYLGESFVDTDPATAARYDAYGVDQQVPYLTQFHHVHLRYQQQGTGPIGFTSSFAGGWDQEISQIPLLEISNTALSVPALTRMDRWMVENRTEITWRKDPDHTVVGGCDLRHSRAIITDLTDLLAAPDAPVPGPETKPVTLLAAYARLVWRLTGGWTLVPELRGTWYAYNGRNEPFAEPRATVRHRLTDTVTLKSAAGLFSQLPDERAYAMRGNPSLSLMKSVQTSVGAEVDLRQGVALESTLFASRLWDLTLSDVDLEYQDAGYGMVYQPVEVFFTGDGRAYGGEVTLRARLEERLTTTFSYAYTRSLRQVDREDEKQTAAMGTKPVPGEGEGQPAWRPGDYDQPHTVTAMGQWRLPGRWTVSARFRVASGQPYTPYVCAWEAASATYYPLEGEPQSARARTFHQLDVRADRTVLKERWRLNVYLDIQNVYNARNPVLQFPNWNCSDQGGTIWIPIVPAFGLKGEF